MASDKPAGQKWGPGVPGVKVRFHIERQGAAGDALRPRQPLQRRAGEAARLPALGPQLRAGQQLPQGRLLHPPRQQLLQDAERSCWRPARRWSRRTRASRTAPFGKGQWDFTCFGRYMVPRKPFGNYFQDDLDKACKALPARPLPFMIGYRRPDDTFLLVAVKQAPARRGAGSRGRLRPSARCRPRPLPRRPRRPRLLLPPPLLPRLLPRRPRSAPAAAPRPRRLLRRRSIPPRPPLLPRPLRRRPRPTRSRRRSPRRPSSPSHPFRPVLPEARP